MKLFSGSASQDLGKKIAQELKISHFPLDQHIFPDGERRVRIPENVVGESVMLVQSTNPPVDTNSMELFFLIDSAKRSGAEFVTAVVPYLGYQRQDHIFRDGEAVSLEVVIRILESLGIDRLISVDMHSVRIPDLFHIPVTHLSAMPLFANYIKTSLFSLSSLGEGQGEVFTPENTVLVSPDMGGIARIKQLSELLDNMPYAALQKNRDLTTGTITVTAVEDGSVSNKKRAIMVDDMISSGQTVLLGAEFLKKQGIEEVIVMATHAVFSEDAPKKLQESLIDAVFVTDTVHVAEKKQFPKLKILSVAPLFVSL